MMFLTTEMKVMKRVEMINKMMKMIVERLNDINLIIYSICCQSKYLYLFNSVHVQIHNRNNQTEYKTFLIFFISLQLWTHLLLIIIRILIFCKLNKCFLGTTLVKLQFVCHLKESRFATISSWDFLFRLLFIHF